MSNGKLSAVKQKIVSRFNKNRSVRGKYDRVNFNRFTNLQKAINEYSHVGDPVLEFFKDSKNFTYVTDCYIVGCRDGCFAKFAHSNEYFEYEFWEDGRRIVTSQGLLNADCVSINNSIFFWVPQKAILPFANLLNFLREGGIQ